MPKARLDQRKRELAQIHIACQQLAIDDSTYRDILWTVARVRSAADLDWAGRRRVIDHLQARGAKIGKAAPRKTASNAEWAFIDQAPEAHRPLLRKICAVCRAMNVGREYAEGVAKRQHGIERRLEMMDTNELWKVAGALEHTRRHGGPKEKRG